MKQLIIILMFITSSSFASEKGNGGDVVRINGKYYLLDMVEAGVEKKPYIDHSLSPKLDFKKRLSKALPSGFPIELIGKKLTEIYNVHSIFALILLRTLESYQWKLVNSSLIDINDEATNLNIPRKDLFQLAIRKESSILVDLNLMKKLDAENQTALIFHEILYALVTPSYVGKQANTGFNISYQRSDQARELNGYLFSDLPRQGLEGFARFNRGFFNSLSGVSNINDPVYAEIGKLIVADPYIQFSISEEWINTRINLGKNVSFGLNTSDSDIDEMMKAACSFATKHRLPVIVRRSLGRGVEISPSIYQSMHGPMTYTEVKSYFDNQASYFFNKLFQDESACLTEVITSVWPQALKMKSEYN